MEAVHSNSRAEAELCLVIVETPWCTLNGRILARQTMLIIARETGFYI